MSKEVLANPDEAVEYMKVTLPNLTRDGSSLIIAQVTSPIGRVIGFCWGYPISVHELEAFLGIKIINPLQKQFGHIYQSGARVIYQKEIRILPAYQDNGLAREMFKRHLNDFIFGGFKLGVVRTMGPPKPSTLYTWYKEELGYLVIAQYPDGQVIMAHDLMGLKLSMIS